MGIQSPERKCVRRIAEQVTKVRPDLEDFGTQEGLHGTLGYIVAPPLEDAQLSPESVVVGIDPFLEYLLVFLDQWVEPLRFRQVLGMYVLVAVEVPLVMWPVLTPWHGVATTA